MAELKEELEQLCTVKRPYLVEQMQEAKGTGDWMDQTEYMLIEAELAFLDGRILELQFSIEHAEIIDAGNEDDIVNIGETVTLRSDEGEIEQYTIVGKAEADPSHGFISNESPLGKALLNHFVGDEVVVHAPVGDLAYQVLAVRPRRRISSVA
ncbi:MAG: transcription elongation factor GreA [Anaerolineales bacterium]|nr:transcription elongation factor GreA [Anaerolineales bacterium]